ncbi:two-component sensor histidine kinase [Clostridia bacterium]|nr:two-component sensor histidine kinase [Clostridia bacterium]
MNFEVYLDYMEEAVLIVDPSYDIVSFNSAFAGLFKVKKSVYALPCLADCPALQELMLSEEAVWSREIFIGESRYSVSVSDIYSAVDAPAGARSFVLTDVTDYGILADAAKRNIGLHKKSAEALSAQKIALEEQTRLQEHIAAGQESDLILRELHDTLGHSLTVLHALSKLALIEGRTDSAAAREYLGETQRLAKICLAELDTLDILGSGGNNRSVGITAFLYRLKQSMLSVSLEVEISITGTEQACHGRLFYPVTRIVQEAATNCLRHAGGLVFKIDIEFGETHIRLAMEDNGTALTGRSEVTKGNGLIGMERRVLDYGGTLEIGVTQNGGVFIRAALSVTKG